MNVLPRDVQRLILQLICRHSGINDIVEITGCSPNTVRRQLARIGEALTAAHDRLVRGISPTRLELDELWEFVYVKRDKNLAKRDKNAKLGPRKRQPPADRGEYYTWTALDPDSRLLVAYHTGDRSGTSGIAFINDLHLRISGRPLISTDGYDVYPDAIQRSFGADVDHVVMQKKIKTWRDPETGNRGSVLVELKKVPQNQSKVDISLASTSKVERMNATIRNFHSRFTRQSFRFSKKFENHLHALSIGFMYYNFAKSHGGFKGQERHYSPAMKAGLTNKLWTFDDLLDETDRYWERKHGQAALTLVPPVQYTPLEPGEWSDRPYFVSFSSNKHWAKVHTATCRDAKRAAKGRKDGPRANKWYAFETEGGARKCAETLAPTEHSVCSICVVGHYTGNMVTGRGPGSVKTLF